MPVMILRSRGLTAAIRANEVRRLRALFEARVPGTELLKSGSPDRFYAIEDGAAGYLVHRDGRTFAHALTRRDAVERLLGDFELAAAESAPGEVFVHAGVAAWKGGAIVLPGRSMSGKTSLVLELLRLGATYYSDEYAVFDSLGRVHPYARPLRIRSGISGQVRSCPARALGAAVGSEPMEVSLIIFARFAPEGAWHARRITPADALLRLIANAVPARKRPRETMQMLRPAALGARSFYASRGDGARAAAGILRLAD